MYLYFLYWIYCRLGQVSVKGYADLGVRCKIGVITLIKILLQMFYKCNKIELINCTYKAGSNIRWSVQLNLRPPFILFICIQRLYTR
jgi:hypothetical protein